MEKKTEKKWKKKLKKMEKKLKKIEKKLKKMEKIHLGSIRKYEKKSTFKKKQYVIVERQEK